MKSALGSRPTFFESQVFYCRFLRRSMEEAMAIDFDGEGERKKLDLAIELGADTVANRAFVPCGCRTSLEEAVETKAVR